MPKILDELALTVGGAVELNGKDDCTDWGVDLRARYQVMDPLSITFFTNVSGTTNDKGRYIKTGIVGNKRNSGYNNGNEGNSPFFKVAMWNHLTGSLQNQRLAESYAEPRPHHAALED